MTDIEKQAKEIFEKLVPMLDEQELHDLIVSGNALMLFKSTQRKEDNQKAG